MTVSFIQGLKSQFENHQIFEQMGKFAGRVWTHIQNFPTYAQNPYVAYSSLVVANCVAYQLARLMTDSFKYFSASDNQLEATQTAVDCASMLIGYGATIGSVTLFVIKAQLPISPYAIVLVSVITIAACIFLETLAE